MNKSRTEESGVIRGVGGSVADDAIRSRQQMHRRFSGRAHAVMASITTPRDGNVIKTRTKESGVIGGVGAGMTHAAILPSGRSNMESWLARRTHAVMTRRASFARAKTGNRNRIVRHSRAQPSRVSIAHRTGGMAGIALRSRHQMRRRFTGCRRTVMASCTASKIRRQVAVDHA